MVGSLLRALLAQAVVPLAVALMESLCHVAGQAFTRLMFADKSWRCSRRMYLSLAAYTHVAGFCVFTRMAQRASYQIDLDRQLLRGGSPTCLSSPPTDKPP